MAVSLSSLAPAVPQAALLRSLVIARFLLEGLCERLARRRRRPSVGDLNPRLLADLGLQRVVLPDGSSRVHPRPVFE